MNTNNKKVFLVDFNAAFYTKAKTYPMNAAVQGLPITLRPEMKILCDQALGRGYKLYLTYVRDMSIIQPAKHTEAISNVPGTPFEKVIPVSIYNNIAKDVMNVLGNKVNYVYICRRLDSNHNSKSKYLTEDNVDATPLIQSIFSSRGDTKYTNDLKTVNLDYASVMGCVEKINRSLLKLKRLLLDESRMYVIYVQGPDILFNKNLFNLILTTCTASKETSSLKHAVLSGSYTVDSLAERYQKCIEEGTRYLLLTSNDSLLTVSGRNEMFRNLDTIRSNRDRFIICCKSDDLYLASKDLQDLYSGSIQGITSDANKVNAIKNQLRMYETRDINNGEESSIYEIDFTL